MNLQDRSNIEFIFGGSFDPVHFGHINVVEKLREECPAWPIRLLPCALPALKDATSVSFERRVDMLKLATDHLDKIVIDERENKRTGKSYTLDSLHSLTQELQATRFVLVVGADTYESMKLWHQWQRLKDYCHLLLVNRPGVLVNDVSKGMAQLGFECTKNIQKLEIMPAGHYYCLSIEEKDISSTGIRSLLHRNLSVEQLIPSKVIDYIKKNLIYSQNDK